MTATHASPARPHGTALPIVIVGAGMAACALARELRRRDATADVTLVGAGAPGPAIPAGVRVLARTRVTGIDTAARTIDTTAGPMIYGRLVLALGAEALRPALAGDGARDVLAVDRPDGVAPLRRRLETLGRPARVVILGAGLAGCELAEDLAGAGHHATLVDPQRRPLSDLVPPPLSAALLRAWAPLSIALRQGAARSLERHADGLRLVLDDGAALDADLVVAATGTRPNAALARAAGLATARGILVDGYGRTSAPHVLALGDCAEFQTAAGAVLRPGLAPLQAAARAIAATLLGIPTPIEDDPVLVLRSRHCPLALCAPAPGSAGEWQLNAEGQRLVARFVDDDGVVRGFACTHPAPALRRALLARLDQAPACA